MIPGRLCALQRAELPERRVARGLAWCRRVVVLQQVHPSPRPRGSRLESSPSSAFPSTFSSPPSFSSFGGVTRGGGTGLLPRLESPGGQRPADAHVLRLRLALPVAACRAVAGAVTTNDLIDIDRFVFAYVIFVLGSSVGLAATVVRDVADVSTLVMMAVVILVVHMVVGLWTIVGSMAGSSGGACGALAG